MPAERFASRGFSHFLRTRLAPAGAAVALALAVSTCGGDSGVEPASVIAFAVQPSNTVAGAPIPAIRVEIRGTSGTIVTSYSGNVTLAITTGTGTGGAALNGTKTVPAVNGVATFNNLSINRSGNGYRLTASSGTLAAATSGLFNIAAGAMSKLAFTVQPGPVTAGSAMVPAVQVTALDDFDNTVTGFGGSVTVAITAGTGAAGATLSGATPVNAVAGVASFPGLSIDKSAAGYTLTASTAGPPVATVTSTPFPVNPGPATRLSFTADPNNATAGAAIAPPITVTAFDAQNNVATNFPGPVTLAITAGTGTAGATLGGTVEVGPVNGVATFGNVNIDRVGTGYTLTASSGALTPGVSASFDIAAGPPAQLAFTVQPSPVTAGAMIAPAVVVEARDAAGNVTPSFTGDVTIAIANNAGPGGVLTGTATVTAVAGVATFADLSIDKSGTGYTLGATSGTLTAATSVAFDVVAGAATTLVFSVPPTSAEAGVTISPAVRVAAQDALGNTDLTFTGDVTVAISAGTGTTGAALSGTTTIAAAAGVATFTDLTIDSVGTGYILTAAATGLTDAVSAAFAITAGPAATIEFTVEPGSAVAGVAISPAVAVTARDAQGNVATFAGAVTLAISAGTGTAGATLSGTATVAAVAGVASFADLSIDSAGTGYTLTASTAGLADAVSAAFDITAGAATQLTFTVEPTSAEAGAAITPAVVVTARDAVGNVDLTFTGDVAMAISAGTGTAGAALTGTTPVAAVAGVATFADLSIDSAGTGYTLTASATGLTNDVSAAFDIAAGAATRLVFTVGPSTTPSGLSITPAVRVAAEDALGNTNPTFTGDVTVAITTGAGTANATLSGTTTIAAVAGAATFADLSIDSVGTGYTLTATATGLTDGVSAAFNILAGPPATIEFSVEPTSAVAGVAISPAVAVTARDAQGNVATDFTGDVVLAITGGTGTTGATLSGTTTVAAVAGVASFADLSIDSVGTGYTLTATTVGVTDDVSAAFAITAGAATQLTFTVDPTSAEAGAAITPAVVVTARDVKGNVATGFTGDVAMAISAGTGTAGAALTGTTPVAALAGVATFTDLSINLAGTGYTLRATSGALTAGVSTAFNITPGAATKLAFTVSPGATVAGATITPAVQVTAQDAFGNLDPTFTGDVGVAITGGTGKAGAALSGTTPVAAVAGVATFNNLSIDSAATGYTLTATSGALTAGVSATFNITAGPATKLAFTVQPANGTAGQAIAPPVQVTAQDALGNLVPGFTSNVTVGITPGTGKTGAALTGTLTRAAVAGVATFDNLSIDSAATGYTLTATSGTLTAAVSTSFNIAGGLATQLAFTGQPTNAAAGVAINPAVVVVARDAGGNLATGFNGDVTVAITGGTGDVGATLLGTKTVAAVSGVATFSTLNVDSIGTGYTLTATSAPLTAATSTPFNITAGPAAALFFTQQPSTESVNGVITPAVVVTARDQFGNVATQFVNNVSMAILNNPGGGALNGSVNKAAVNGVATFSNLSISAAGVGYTLRALSTGVTGATSAPFNIDPQVAVTLFFTTQPAATVAGATIPTVRVSARDVSGSVVVGFIDQVTLTITPGTGNPGASLSGVAAQTAVGGTAEFSGLSIDSTGTYKLTATAPGLSGLSAFFNINPGAAAQFAFTVPPSNAVAAPSTITPQIQVTAFDALGNVATGYTGPVSVAIAPGTGAIGAVLGGTSSQAAVAGVASFPGLTINLPSPGYQLNASDGSGAGVPTVTSGTFEITAVAGSHLAYSVQPSSAVAGANIAPPIVVRMLDGVGALDASFTGAVTLAIEAGSGGSGAVLSGITTVNAVAGEATFSNLSINRTGADYRLLATASGAAGARSALFAITAAAAARLDVQIQPTTTTAGDTMAAFTVRALDQFGNVNSTFTGPVTVAISVNPAGGTLSGTTTVNAIAGVATFNTLSIDRAETGYRFEVTSPGLTPDQSNAFSITGGAPVRIAFTVQPTNTTAGLAITPIVRVTGFDALDNIATFGGGETVTLTITPGTGSPGAVLTGGGPVTPINGVASFNPMTVNLVGTGYTLTASSGALPTVVSTAFAITP